MRALTFAFAGTALSLTACNSDRSSQSASQDNLESELNAPATTRPTAAQTFINAAAASDKFEIESSKLAENAGASAKVSAFAKQMIKGHTDSTAKLKAVLGEMSPPTMPDDALNAEQQSALDTMEGLKGASFDAAYAKAQAAAHQKTLNTLKAYSASGDNPALVAFAKELIPVVTAHLNMANGLTR